MSLIFPKKPLYAPMIGTLGGGSARGFGRGGRPWGYDFPVGHYVRLTSYNTNNTAGAIANWRSGWASNSANTNYANNTWLDNDDYMFEDPTYKGLVWGVPEDGTYQFQLAGGAGGNARDSQNGYEADGGAGAIATANFTLSKKQYLRIIVGKAGDDHETPYYVGSGGGGASAIMTYSEDVTQRSPLLVAGGGGGAAITYYNPTSFNGFPAGTNNAGAPLFGHNKTGSVGFNANGNVTTGYGGFEDTQESQRLDAGAGFYGDGQDNSGDGAVAKALRDTAYGRGSGGYGGGGSGASRGGGAGGGYSGGSSISKGGSASDCGVGSAGSSYFSNSVVSGSLIGITSGGSGNFNSWSGSVANNYGSSTQSGWCTIIRLS
jgi:hypothetical protein